MKRLFTLLLVGMFLMLAGCSAGVVRESVIGGVVVIEHLDAESSSDYPCITGGENSEKIIGIGTGCHQRRGDTHHVWYSDLAMPDIKYHEAAGHGRGMLHTVPWEIEYSPVNGKPINSCATVIIAGGEYVLGDRICMHSRYGEIITRNGETWKRKYGNGHIGDYKFYKE